MLISGLVVYLGFCLLALNKNRHLQQIWPSKEFNVSVKKLLDITGWLLLTLAAVYLVYDSGIGNGLVKYTAVLSVSGLLLVFQFSYWPRSVLAIALIENVVDKIQPDKSEK